MGWHEIKNLPTWRRVALSAWGAPSDPTAYGTLDIDCENALAYLDLVRARTGEKATLTHLVGKALSMAIAARPEVNGFVSRGRLMARESIDVFFQVAFFDESSKAKPKNDNANLAGAKIRNTDQKSVAVISRELRERAEKIRANADTETARGSKTIASLPRSLVGFATRAGAYLSYDLGLNLSRFGIPYDAFGSCMVTNVGVFGIPVGYAPLLAMARVPLVVTLGAVREAACVRDGSVVVRRCVTVGVAFDHRVMDGFHAGVMAKRFSEILGDPARELGQPPADELAPADAPRP